MLTKNRDLQEYLSLLESLLQSPVDTVVYQLLRQECSCGVDCLQSVAVLVVKDSWFSGAALEQSNHLLLDGIQKDTGGVVGCVCGMSYCQNDEPQVGVSTPLPHW